MWCGDVVLSLLLVSRDIFKIRERERCAKSIVVQILNLRLSQPDIGPRQTQFQDPLTDAVSMLKLWPNILQAGGFHGWCALEHMFSMNPESWGQVLCCRGRGIVQILNSKKFSR